MLRQEVFADDGDENDDMPFTVATSTVEVRQLQPAGTDEASFGVFHVVPHQSVQRHYERTLDGQSEPDPRTSHTLALEVDAYGKVLREAQVGYPRRTVPTGLDPQGELHMVVTESDFIHDDTATDRLHLGVPWRARSLALTGVAYTESSPATIEDVEDDLDNATEIDFEDAPAGGTTVQTRLLSHEQTRYFANDLSGSLSAGTLGLRALVYERYRLTYTADLLSSVYGSTVTDTMLEEEGGYVDLLSDDHYWVRSGHPTLSATHFYQPTEHTDAFGNATTLTWDSHKLFLTEVEAPLTTGATASTGLTTTADIDYRVLQPWKVTEPNGTEQQAEFDALGRVVKTAVVGPNSEGDTLSAPTTEVSYDVHRWANQGLPSKVHIKARTEHGGSTFLETWTYSDGGGNEVLTKTQAAPGDAPSLVDDEVEWSHSDPRYIGSGRTVVDNKGNPVKQ